MQLGVDIVETSRIEQALINSGDKFVQRVLTAAEREYLGKPLENIERFAGLWAAKEAAVKALGVGFRHGIIFHDIHIVHDEWGMPCLRFHGEFLKIMQLKKLNSSTLSISHCRTHAIAAVLFGP